MPYPNERATGDSLWRLEDNPSVKAFRGSILIRNDQEGIYDPPPDVKPLRRQNPIRRIIAVDGSTVLENVQNGFPRAQASLFNAAVILIKVEELKQFHRDNIPRPSQLRELEKVSTMSAVLPGPNVVGLEPNQDTPKKSFRNTVRQELNFRLDDGHESLEPVYNLFRISTMKASTTICRLVLSFLSQFFQSRRHFSSQAKDRSTTHRFGSTTKVCSSLRCTTSTAAPNKPCTAVAKGFPV